MHQRGNILIASYFNPILSLTLYRSSLQRVAIHDVSNHFSPSLVPLQPSKALNQQAQSKVETWTKTELNSANSFFPNTSETQTIGAHKHPHLHYLAVRLSAYSPLLPAPALEATRHHSINLILRGRTSFSKALQHLTLPAPPDQTK